MYNRYIISVYQYCSVLNKLTLSKSKKVCQPKVNLTDSLQNWKVSLIFASIFPAPTVGKHLNDVMD